MNRTKKFATPAGNTIRGILDYWFSGLLVQAKNILWTDRKTDPTARAEFLVQFVYSHESLPSKLLVVYPKNITMFDSLLDGLQSTQALSEI
jgi:hypothetical protein